MRTLKFKEYGAVDSLARIAEYMVIEKPNDSLSKVDLCSAWRYGLSVLAGMILGTVLAAYLLPQEASMSLFVGVCTGAFVGGIAGMVWQFLESGEKGRSSFQFRQGVGITLWFGLMTGIAWTVMVPMLRKQETMVSKLRRLGGEPLQKVVIRSAAFQNADHALTIFDEEQLKRIGYALTKTKVYEVHHEEAVSSFELVFVGKTSLSCPRAWISNKNLSDVVLDFPTTTGYVSVRVPGLVQIISRHIPSMP